MERSIIEVDQEGFMGSRVGFGLFLVPILCGLSLMFALSPLLTDNTFLNIHYVYETSLLCVGVICIIILTCVLKRSDSRVRPAFSKYYPVFIIITGAGSLILPCIDIYMIHFLKSCSPAIRHIEGIAIMDRVVVSCFTVSLCVFVLYLRNRKTRDKCSSFFLTVVMAATLSLCVCGAKNTFWANNIISADVGNSTTYVSPGLAIFKKCLNVSSWNTHVRLYRNVYHYGYKFQTEFSLFSLIIIMSGLKFCLDTPINDDQATADEENISLINSFDESSYEQSINSADHSSYRYGSVTAKVRYDIRYCVSNYSACIAVILVLLTFTGFYLCDKLKLINWKDTADETVGYSIAQFVYNLVIAGVTLVAYVSTTQFVTERRRLNAREFVFLVSSGGHMTLLLFETALVSEGETNVKAWLFLLKTVLHFIDLFVRIMLVMKLARIHDIRVRRSDAWWPYVAFRVALVFVGAINFEKWIGDTVFTPSFIKHINASHRDLHLQITWKLITQVLYPFVVLSRLLVAIACFEAYAKFQKKSRNIFKKCLIFMYEPW